MDVTESSSTGGSRGGGGSDEPPVVKPLTRNGYRRLAKVELQIADAVMLDGPAIVERARQRDEGAPGFLRARSARLLYPRCDRERGGADSGRADTRSSRAM